MNKPHIIGRAITAQSLNSSECLLKSTNLIARFRENCELIKNDTTEDILIPEGCRRACEHATTEVNMRRAATIFKDDMGTAIRIEVDKDQPNSLSRVVNLLIKLYTVARLAFGSSSDIVCSL